MPRPTHPWYWSQRDVWVCTVKGKRKTLARGKASKREAMEEFHRLMVREGSLPAQHQFNVADLFDAFLEDIDLAVERDERARSTYEGYVRFLTTAAEHFGVTRAAELKPHQVHRWCNSPDLKWGSTTRANAITIVKACFRWAKRRGYIEVDPVRDLEKPPRRRREAVLTDEQVERIVCPPWRTAGTAFADLIFALWESGCRPREVTTLTADRVDLEAATWTVENKTRAKTGQRWRVVYLTPALVGLSRRLVAARPEGLIFRNARGRPWTRNAQACAWRRLRAELGWGAEATSYAVRHRYARAALKAGLPSSDVAALMGHTDARMVDTVYGGWAEQGARLREAARRVRPPAVSTSDAAAPTAQSLEAEA